MITKEEFTKYLKYVIDSGITIYFGDYLALSDNDENERNEALEVDHSIYAYQHNKHVIRTLENVKEADLSVTEQMQLQIIQENLSKYTNGDKIYTKQKMSN